MSSPEELKEQVENLKGENEKLQVLLDTMGKEVDELYEVIKGLEQELESAKKEIDSLNNGQ